MTTALEVLRKPIELSKLVWPVFKLGEREPIQIEGVICYNKQYMDAEIATYTNTYKIVDDKTIDKPTLGLRRLEIKNNLYPIGTAIYFLQDVIKLAKPTTWFIDSHGQLFQHKKSTRAKLQTYKIIQVLPAQGIGCILEVAGLAERFKSLQVPEQHELYCGILSYRGKNLLYGFYTEPIKPTWRLV